MDMDILYRRSSRGLSVRCTRALLALGIVTALLLCTLVCARYFNWRRIVLWQIGGHEPARQEIAYEEEPTNAEVLLHDQKKYYRLPSRNGAVAGRRSDVLDGLGHHDARHRTALLFVHRLHPRHGKDQVVSIEVAGGNGPMLFIVGRYGMDGDDYGGGIDEEIGRELRTSAGGPPLRIYSGYVDPSDASAFIIPFVKGDRMGEIHGQLADDAVSLEVRYTKPRGPSDH